jgi:hypothetical protein
MEEHPGGKERARREHPGAEHPRAEHPRAGPQEELSLDEVARTIEEHIRSDAALKGGYYTFYDRATGKPLALALERVHRDKLSMVSEDTCFACADFRSTEGKLYDLDMFARRTAEGLTVVEVDVHKEEDKPRYQWTEEGGLWRKR